MLNRLFANLILSCAAVLFLPQALECCHTGSHTVLESLSGMDAAQPMSGHHHMAGMTDSAASLDRGTPPSRTTAVPTVSLPAGAESAQ